MELSKLEEKIIENASKCRCKSEKYASMGYIRGLKVAIFFGIAMYFSDKYGFFELFGSGKSDAFQSVIALFVMFILLWISMLEISNRNVLIRKINMRMKELEEKQ